MTPTTAYLALAAFLLALTLTPIARALGRRLGLLDTPNERSSHVVPTPRTGGAAILTAFFFVTAFMCVYEACGTPLNATLVATAVIALLGLVDDVKDLSGLTKLVVQIICAIGVIRYGGALLSSLELPWMTVHFSTISAAILSVLWILSLANAFNFMDGINGISSVQAAVASGAMALMFARNGDAAGCALAAVLGASALGFFPFNFPSGSIFMGDTGSAAIGFILAVLAVRLEHAGGSYVAAVLCVAPFLSDSGVTLVRRIAASERFYSAHRSHFYQRLVSAGWSHGAVTALWTVLALISAVTGLRYAYWTPIRQVVAVGGIVMLHGGVFLFIYVLERRRASTGLGQL